MRSLPVHIIHLTFVMLVVGHFSARTSFKPGVGSWDYIMPTIVQNDLSCQVYNIIISRKTNKQKGGGRVGLDIKLQIECDDESELEIEALNIVISKLPANDLLNAKPTDAYIATVPIMDMTKAQTSGSSRDLESIFSISDLAKIRWNDMTSSIFNPVPLKRIVRKEYGYYYLFVEAKWRPIPTLKDFDRSGENLLNVSRSNVIGISWKDIFGNDATK